MAHVFVHHTSASVILCENADDTVRRDLDAFFARLVPDGDPRYTHDAEGADDMPAHLRTILTSSSVQLSGRPLALWTDITPTTNVAADISAPTIFVSNISDTTVDIGGKIAVVSLVAPPPAAIRSTTNTYEYNYTRPAIAAMGTALTRRGAAGVIIVADSIAELAFDGVAKVQSRGTYDVIGGVPVSLRDAYASHGHVERSGRWRGSKHTSG